MNQKIFSLLAAATTSLFIGEQPNLPDIPTIKHKYNFFIPKGTKLYLFDHDGSFTAFTEFASRNEMPNYCVFYTIATNDKSAIRKFEKFKNNQ